MGIRKIAILTDGIYPYVMGGMQRHSYLLTKYLAGKGIQVDLYHCGDKPLEELKRPSAFTEKELSHINSIPMVFPKGNGFPGHYMRSSYEYSKRIFDHLKQNLAVDFIYVKGFSGWKLMEERGKGLRTPPVALMMHGYEMFQPAHGLKSWMEQVLILRNATRYNISHSDYMISYGGKITNIIESLGVPKFRIIEIPSGVQKDSVAGSAKAAEGVRRFVFLGRFEKRKGVELINDCLKSLQNTANFEFHFIGPIPDRSKVKSKTVHYHGAMHNELDIREALSGMDVLVCPSISEGMPNAILEGMSAGLAVIASDVGAISTMVNEDNGWLIQPGNSKSLRQAIESAMKLDSESLKHKKEKSLQKIKENFLWENLVERTVTELEKKLK